MISHSAVENPANAGGASQQPNGWSSILIVIFAFFEYPAWGRKSKWIPAFAGMTSHLVMPWGNHAAPVSASLPSRAS
jgi:hypothetical protein